MKLCISGLLAIAAFALASGHSRAANLTTLVSFDGINGAYSEASLIADASGNLFGTAQGGGTGSCYYGGCGGIVFEIAKTNTGYANSPTILVNFCSQPNCADGASPRAGLIADANGNLFGTTYEGGTLAPPSQAGTVFEVAKTATGYASTPTTLVSFNLTDGAHPYAGLIADANGNLFGTTNEGGAYGGPVGYGTVFKIAKTPTGYASTPTTLVSFNFTDGQYPYGGLIADASGNLFGTTVYGGLPPQPFANNWGTVFEITGSGFVVPGTFAGTPGKANCYGQSVSALVGQFGGLSAAAAASGFSGVGALQNAILAFCGE